MPIDDQHSNGTIDWAFQQAEQIIQTDIVGKLNVDSKVLEELGGHGGLTNKLGSLLGESEKNKIFYIFIHILAGASKIEIDNLQIKNFLALFNNVEYAKNFVKEFLKNVHAHLSLELLFEIQAVNYTTEQLKIIHQLSEDADITCSDQYRNKFKKIVLWIKEIDGYIKNHLALKELKHKPTKIGNLIDWYHEIAVQAFSKNNRLHSKVGELLFQLSVGPNEIEAFKKLKSKTKEINDKILPDVVVAGDGYFICKLSHHDPRGPFLGLSTGCCQHLGGVGRKAAVYGYTEDNACFYVMFKGKLPEQRPIDTAAVLKTKDIVAQCLAWRNQDEKETIVFDSIEMDSLNKSKESLDRQRSVKSLFFELAKKIVDVSNGQIQHVMVGANSGLQFGIGSEILSLKNTNIPANLGYTDAIEQYLGYSSTFKELLKYFVYKENQKLDPEAALLECQRIDFSKLLLAAVEAESTNALEFALRNCVDIYANGVAAFIHAVEKNKPEPINAIIDSLSKAGISSGKLLDVVNAKNKYCNSALAHAAQRNYPECINAIFHSLINAGISNNELLTIVKAKDYRGETALAKSLDVNESECINAIIDSLSKSGVSNDELLAVVNIKNKRGMSLLMQAVELGHPKCIYAIFDSLSRARFSKAALLKIVNAKNNDGSTAFMEAARGKRRCLNTIMDSLSKAMISNDQLLYVVNVKNNDGWTALMNAVTSDDQCVHRILDSLIKARISNDELLNIVNAENNYGNSSLTFAFGCSGSKCLIALCDCFCKAIISNDELLTVLNAFRDKAYSDSDREILDEYIDKYTPQNRKKARLRD